MFIKKKDMYVNSLLMFKNQYRTYWGLNKWSYQQGEKYLFTHLFLLM